MIYLTDIDGKAVYIAPGRVASIRETSGYRTLAVVTMEDGQKFEVREKAADIALQLEAALRSAA